MINRYENNIREAVKTLGGFCSKCEFFSDAEEKTLPSRDVIIDIIRELRKVIFPCYFGDATSFSYEYFAGNTLTGTAEKLSAQIAAAISYKNTDGLSQNEILLRTEKVCRKFIDSLPKVQSMLEKDVLATYDGDPAAHDIGEIIVSYPGIFAIFVYRTAHILYEEKIPLIPRIMTEYAHSRTGIDINAGAKIGEYFFIDHGTGVVVGETTEIGNRVKIYQGVTLGALSTRMGQKLSGVKRHPTIGNDVTIYSGSTILGGETVIGDGAIIGGNAFITQSVPPRTKVTVKAPELIFKSDESKCDIWEI